MKSFYEIRDGSLEACTPEKAAVIVCSAPNEEERQRLLDELQIDGHSLESALDPDEISRVEFGPEHIYVVWKRPSNVTFADRMKFEVSSVGLFVSRGHLTFITAAEDVPFTGRSFQKVSSLNDVVLGFFLHTVHHFFAHLKAIRQMNSELQAKLVTSMENRYLLQMFSLEESLTYYLNAIEENASVLSRFRTSTARVGFSEEEVERLDDLIIEHEQCLRQAQIYSSVLSGLMDARGNIINNNMNVLLRNLTLINVVFLPLNLIASIFGMSEFSVITGGVDWRISYSLFLLGMVILGGLTWHLLIQRIDKGRPRTEDKR